MLMKKFLLLFLLSFLGNSAIIEAQSVVDFPCQGSTTLDEDFTTGIPFGWLVVDGDTLQPDPALNMVKGWTTIKDYKDTNNIVAASASWYTSSGGSNDWLITSSVTLGSNPCLSWRAYSQDAFYPESYEVRISTAGSDTTDFLANSFLDSIAAESSTPVFRLLDLSAYSGQSVRIAFRQTTADGFVLVLDSIRISDVSQLDAGVIDVDSVSAEALAPVDVYGEIINAGLDTIESVTLNWSVDGGTVRSMTLDSLSLSPNTSLTVKHDSAWTPDTTKSFQLCFWTSSPNSGTDGNNANDTTCQTVVVNNFVGRSSSLSNRLKVYPNPASNWIKIAGEFERLGIKVYDMQGRLIKELVCVSKDQIDISELRPGFYNLEIVDLVNWEFLAFKLIKK